MRNSPFFLFILDFLKLGLFYKKSIRQKYLKYKRENKNVFKIIKNNTARF